MILQNLKCLQELGGTNDSISSPEILGQIGYMITDRYV
jgi:hypothetical protein